MKITVYISTISFFFPFRIMLEILFAVKTKREIRIFTFTNFLDLLFLSVFMIRFIEEYTKYENSLDKYKEKYKMAIRYYENIYEYSNDELLIDFIYWIGVFSLWIRFLYMLRLTKFLGPLLKMISLMLWEILTFMVLYVIILIIYSSIGTLLFYSDDQYQDFWTAFITLFSSTLGNFDFTELSTQAKGKLVGDLYLISFLVITAILTLNLLVAILTNIYQNLESKRFVLYISEILKLKSSHCYDKRASGLISTPPPWNIFPLLLSPLYFLRIDQVKLNAFVLHVWYVPVLLIATLVFITVNLAIFPFAYFKGVAIKAQFLFYRKSKSKFYWRLLSLLVFISFGVFILLLNLCVDMVFFQAYVPI